MAATATKGPRYRQTQLWRDANRFLVEVETAVRTFSRYDKYTLGSDLRRQAINICRLVACAAQSRAGPERAQLLVNVKMSAAMGTNAVSRSISSNFHIEQWRIMMQAMASGWSVLCLLALLLWAGNAQAVPCQNNIPASNPDSVYTDHGNGTVTDTRNGLMWKQCAEGLNGETCQTGSAQTFTWANALAHAEASTFASYTDWRLPNIKELSSLVEECRGFPSINTNHFPNAPRYTFWSGSSSSRGGQAWTVLFEDGNALSRFKSSGFRVRLVRGGQ